jgi:hypothetical protein
MRIDCIRLENLAAFWTAAALAYEDAGRRAIVVDTTVRERRSAHLATTGRTDIMGSAS